MTSQKLPRKEDLLKKQTTPQKETPVSAGENPDVKKSKEDAEIAANNLKRRESEINLKLKEDGYKTLEDGLADVKRKNEDADKLLKYAQDKEREIAEKLEKLEEEKQKIVNAYAIDKKMKDMADARLQEAMRLEKVRKSEEDNHNALRDELKHLIEYHAENIKPCRKVLLSISKAIYNWTDTLAQAKIDFTSLYNYIGKIMVQLDNYINTEDFQPPTETQKEEKPPTDTPTSD